MGQFEQSEFKRIEHAAESPVLTTCDFFLFGDIGEQLNGRSFAREKELLSLLSGLARRTRLTRFCGFLPTGIEGYGFVF
jgi:hypothetical protein